MTLYIQVKDPWLAPYVYASAEKTLGGVRREALAWLSLCHDGTTVQVVQLVNRRRVVRFRASTEKT